MRNIFYSIFILLLISFGSISAQVLFSDLQNRNGIYYKVNSNELFTEMITEKFENGKKRFIANYKDGKLDGEFIEWYEKWK